MTEPRHAFSGPVRCLRAAPPLSLTLTGAAAAPHSGLLTLSFAAAAAPDLPEALTDASVEAIGGGRYRILAAAREWLISARGLTVTREIAAEFYRALPPRPVPAGKRFMWRVVLALAASRAGLALLRVLRR
jgi:hypothetical protein